MKVVNRYVQETISDVKTEPKDKEVLYSTNFIIWIFSFVFDCNGIKKTCFNWNKLSPRYADFSQKMWKEETSWENKA
jgi:hypothetical protein